MGTADAATFCLGKPACPEGTAVASLQEAFDKAKAEAGRDPTVLTSKIGSYVLGLTNETQVDVASSRGARRAIVPYAGDGRARLLMAGPGVVLELSSSEQADEVDLAFLTRLR